MPSTFTILRSRCGVLTDATLRDEIQGRTGNDAETSSIIRSIGRFGSDASIQYYEMTPKTGRRTSRANPSFAWTVTAVR